MNKKELILRKLSIITLNNKITELNTIIDTQNLNNMNSYNKSKQLFTELIQSNKKIASEKIELEKKLSTSQQEIDTLKQQLNYQQSVIERIPKFLLRFFIKNKDIKLLNEGTNKY